MRENARGSARLEIAALAVCLAGFIGFIAVMLELKAGVMGIPRIVYVGFLAMACGPFYVALWQSPRPLFLVPPVIAVFLLYPVATPFGIVWAPDPIFNFSFTETVVASGFWVPGETGTFDVAYSYYPVGNVFIGYIILTADLPSAVAFLWIEPVLRLLTVPAAVYAIGRRRFKARTAALGLFLYTGTASILFNVPVQQGMGIVFVALALLSLLMLTQTSNRVHQRRVLFLFALVSGGIVMTHHLSSYVFAGWLASLAVLMPRHRLQANVPALRWGLLCVYFIFLLGVYIAAFTYPVFIVHERSFDVIIDRLATPELLWTSAAGGPSLGRTFTSVEVAWIGGSIVGLLVLALSSIHLYRRARIIPFTVANGLVGAGLILVTLPLVATAARDVPLRVGEYANLFIAPFAAATLIRWSQSGLGRFARFAPASLRKPKSLPTGVALFLAAALFMGGSMVPGTNRLYFESPDGWLTDSPLVAGGADAQRAGEWGRIHFGQARFWGDQLAVNVFSGFAHMRTEFGSSHVFVNDTLNETVWAQLAVGDYVVVNRWMTVLTPRFLHEPEPAPPATFGANEVGKFARDPHFALVFQDETFSVYRVMSKPPP